METFELIVTRTFVCLLKQDTGCPKKSAVKVIEYFTQSKNGITKWLAPKILIVISKF